MPKFIDRTGEVHGDLTVVARADNNSWGEAMWWCRCKCGRYALVLGGSLRSGATKSCGCLQKKRTIECHTTHGMEGTRQYKIWCNMLQRCENENNKDCPRYGGRGIKVCERWHKFENFWADMKDGYADDLTLERIDNDGDYCPENCRWATFEEQQNNKRNNLALTIYGKTQTLAQHVADPEINTHNLKESTVRGRIKRGWTPEEAFSTPPSPRG